jgi:hypothetical protein
MGGILFIICVAFVIIKIQKKRKKVFSDLGIPPTAIKVKYYKNYTPRSNSEKVYFWNDNASISFCNPKKTMNIKILKEDIISFNMLGEYHESTNVSGGGVSIGGAIAGAAVAGPVGAIIGGGKKVKTETIIDDSRKTVIRYNENNINNGIIVDKSVFNILCFMCPEKKIS